MENASNNIPLLMLAGIIGMLFLALAIIAFFVVYQRRLLAQQQEMNRMEKEQQRRLLASTLQAQEDERKRIAQDLHDSVGSQLAAAKLYLGQLPADGPGQVPLIKAETRSLLDNTIGSVRAISQNLLPPNLETLGLPAALEDLCAVLEKAGSHQVDLQHDAPGRFDPQIEVTLYRIAQELVNNTLKHAEASQIDMRLTQQNGTLSLAYRDNGRGFDLGAQQEKRHGLGLHGIESRAQFIGADLSLDTAPQQGMRVKISLPIPQKVAQPHAPDPEKA